MHSDTLRLYHSPASPNSRRVRIFLAEKGLRVPLIAVDLGKGEQHSEAYRAINPRRVVPTLVLEDGTGIGEVPAIMRYLDEVLPEKPLLGATPKDKGLIAMWERRAELEGFAAVMEGVRNKIAGLKGRAIAGPHDYEQIPGLVERSVLRVKNFFADFNERLGEVPFCCRRALLGRGYHRPGDGGLCQGARAVRAGGPSRAEALVRVRVQPCQCRRLILLEVARQPRASELRLKQSFRVEMTGRCGKTIPSEFLLVVTCQPRND